jgi:hypothetical protein
MFGTPEVTGTRWSCSVVMPVTEVSSWTVVDDDGIPVAPGREPLAVP